MLISLSKWPSNFDKPVGCKLANSYKPFRIIMLLFIMSTKSFQSDFILAALLLPALLFGNPDETLILFFSDKSLLKTIRFKIFCQSAMLIKLQAKELDTFPSFKLALE